MRYLLLITAFFSLCFTQQTYDSEIQPIWDANCTRCHGSSGNLDLSQGVSYSNIVNVVSSGYSGFLLVEPNDPMNSVMHQKIVGNSAFGERMPKNASKLSTSDENKIKTWIDNGALKDWSGGGSGTPNTLEIVVRLNQNIGNGDVHVGVWLPGNAGNPEITDNKDNLTSPSPTEGWGFELTDPRITPNNGPYSVEVFFDKNNNQIPDVNEPYAIFDLNTDNQGYAFQDIDIILEPGLYTGPFKTKITVNNNQNEFSGYLSFRVFDKGTIIKDELPNFPGALYSYDSPNIYENAPKDLDLMIDDWLQNIPYGDYPIIAFYDEWGGQTFDPAYEHIGTGFLKVRNGDMAEAIISPLERLPGPVIENTGLTNLTVNENEDFTLSVNVNKNINLLAGEVDMLYIDYFSGDYLINDSYFCDEISNGIYECSISRNDITNKGLVFWLYGIDEYGASSDMGPYDLTVQFNSIFVSSFQTQKYVMISVPAKINNQSTQGFFVEQLGDPDPSVWRTFKWQNGVYQENSGSLSPGSAVWLISKDVGEIYASNGRSTEFSMGFSIILSNGWNQIGNPYNFPIDINDDFYVTITPGVEQQLYEYNDGDNYTETSVMEPGSGYWVYSNGNGQININTIFGFPPLSEQSEQILAKQNLGWKVNLEVSTGDQRDRSTRFGVHPNAKAAYDKYDFHEPPVIGEYVSAYFKHSEASNLNQDIQNEGEMFYSWSLAVQTNQAGISEVVIPNVNEIPYEHSVKLFDPVTQVIQDMRQNSSFKFASQGSENPHYFELMVGTDESIDAKLEKIGVVPNKFELAQNIPNPFNPVTNILVSLKEDATISLKVFNLLGEEINSMAMNQPMSKGNHRFIWSGKSNNGQPLPSGIYLYRLEVLSNNGNPVYQNTKKMILMK